MPPVAHKAARESRPSERGAGQSRPAGRAKPPRKKSPSSTPTPAPPAGNLPRVRVRMYRQGLGDCVLPTFDPGGDEKHVLIDCGTLGSGISNIKKVEMPEVIADIDRTTNGHLHLVVATHQHQDHLSGFQKLSNQFSPEEDKHVDHVWLAWTENPQDKLARQLGKARDDMGIAVRASAQALRARSADH